MGRPRVHNDLTAAALLDAAERIVGRQGLEALTVRSAAEAVGATTRSVYSTYGSKDGLVAALGSRAFEMLGAAVRARPVTDDPVADLIDVATAGFRAFALQHPALFQLGIQQTWLPLEVSRQILPAAGRALTFLHERLRRLERDGLLGRREIGEAAVEFHALCEGLAAVELRGFLPDKHAEQVWNDAIGALVTGWRTAGESGTE
jgi:AcrR family transcriptional regulator